MIILQSIATITEPQVVLHFQVSCNQLSKILCLANEKLARKLVRLHQKFLETKEQGEIPKQLPLAPFHKEHQRSENSFRSYLKNLFNNLLITYHVFLH